MKRIIFIIFLLNIMLLVQMTCFHEVDGHQWFMVENQTDDYIYIRNEFLHWNKPNGLGGSIFPSPKIPTEDTYRVHSQKSRQIDINYYESWEDVFKKSVHKGDSIVTYVGKMQDERGKDYATAVQIYVFSLEDLVGLDFSFSYPPNPNMRHIKMLPTYEDAIAGKTLQDIDLEQED